VSAGILNYPRKVLSEREKTILAALARVPASSGGGAPTTAQYVTMAADATLTSESVLTAGAGITLTPGAGTITVSASASVSSDSASVSQIPGQDGEDGAPAFGLATGVTSRSQLATDAKGWAFLGTATGATVTVGPVIWTGQYRQFMVKYFIAGYNGGTPVGRFLVGVGTPSTTALTNGSRLSENVTAPTSAPSIPGIPLAVTLSAIAREGWIFVDGASGSFKNINVLGQNGNAAVAAPPNLYRACGVFSNLGTNLLLQQAQLTVYDTLVATAASAQTFTAGTYLSVWGRNND
jgi:hypothetical protein